MSVATLLNEFRAYREESARNQAEMLKELKRLDVLSARLDRIEDKQTSLEARWDIRSENANLVKDLEALLLQINQKLVAKIEEAKD